MVAYNLGFGAEGHDGFPWTASMISIQFLAFGILHCKQYFH
jgi:hypothetical protein